MGNVWDRMRGWLGFGDVDEAAAEALEEEARREREATRKANRRFDRHGPHPRDMLPGSPRAKLFRRGRRR